MRRLGSLLIIAASTLLLHCSHGETPRYGYIADRTRSTTDDANGMDQAWSVPDFELDPAGEPRPVRFLDSEPLLALQPQSSIDLSGYFPVSAQLVGVALDERDESAQPYLLEARSGLYQLTSSGVQQVFDLRASRVIGGTGDGSPPVELTDVAFDRVRSEQKGTPSFALTAENDGFALDLPDPILESYFCYFPETFEPLPGPAPSVSQELRQQGIAVVERTEAVALNPITHQIVAQPRTLRLDSGDVAGSELFVFDAAGGSPIGTWRLERNEFAAGGAAFQLGTYLTFGFGSDLYFTGDWGSDVVHQLHLDGVGQITGLAARANGDLLVLDGANGRLFELGRDQIAHTLGN